MEAYWVETIDRGGLVTDLLGGWRAGLCVRFPESMLGLSGESDDVCCARARRGGGLFRSSRGGGAEGVTVFRSISSVSRGGGETSSADRCRGPPEGAGELVLSSNEAPRRLIEPSDLADGRSRIVPCGVFSSIE